MRTLVTVIHRIVVIAVLLLAANAWAQGGPGQYQPGPGPTPTSGSNTTITDNTKSADYTVALPDISNALTLTGAHALTLPAALFQPGLTLTINNVGTGNWALTNSTGLTLRGLNGATIYPGTQGTFVANADGTHLDFFPGCQVGTSSAPGCSYVYPIAPGFRLSSVSSTDGSSCVEQTDQLAVGTIYWVPGCGPNGNHFALYSGSSWVNFYQGTVLSLALTCTSGKDYDVWLQYNSGTPQLALSAAWTNDTTRAQALALQDGFPVQSGTPANLWLGSLRCNGTNATEDSVANRLLYNHFNQAPRFAQIINETESDYTTATWRYYANSSANAAQFLLGDSQAVISSGHANVQASGDGACPFDWTSGSPASPYEMYEGNVLNTTMSAIVPVNLALGYHFIAAIQLGGTVSSKQFSIACAAHILD